MRGVCVTGWYVTANDIKVWTASSKRRAEEILPLLVKKLIIASCKPTKIDFPTGDSVAIGGWDGILDVEEGDEFIPSGKSGWEFGTNENVKGKADDDYAKRLEKPSPFNLKEASFVFVTSRLWTKRDNWILTKQKDNQWKDVRGLNAEDLQNWLEQCPAVHRWFSKIIGKRSSNLLDIEQAWETFSNTTKVKLTTDFFLYERNDAVEKLNTLLAGQPNIIRVKSRLINEAYGFILSIIQNDPTLSARCLVIKKQEEWDLMAQSNQELILIPKDFYPSGLGAAVAKGHIVLMAVDEKSSQNTDINLDHQQRLIKTEAIKKLGFDDTTANLIYQDTKGYLNPLLRHTLMQPNDYDQPSWPETFSANVLFAMLFATEWKEDSYRDKEMMELLSGMPYQEFEQEIIKLCTVSDPPVRKIGSVWQIISKIDLWLQISPKLAILYLERLGSAVEKVFVDLDPSYDLPSEERYMANIKGATPLYSNLLKQGLADSLAILAAYGDDFSEQIGGEKPSELIRYWINKIFEVNNNTQYWYSIKNLTSLIAESAPEAYLDSVEKGSEGEHSPLLGLFKEEEDGIFGACHHSGLLWGLEVVSWNKKYLSRVSLCLARLAEIDPGGNWGNRPFKSLVDMYLGWINNITATHKERLQVIEQVLLPNYPDITWKLMKNLLLNSTRVTSGIQKPRYREWLNNYDDRPRLKEYYNYMEKIVNIMIREVGNNFEDRIYDLVDNFDSYNEEQQEQVINYLMTIDASEVSPSTRSEMLNNLRDILSHHREYPNAEWSWSETVLERLEEVYNNLNYDHLVKNNLYLFDEFWPKLIEPINKKEVDFEERAKLMLQKRLDAIKSIHNEYGIEGILELVSTCKLPVLVGEIGYKSSIKETLLPLALEWIESNDSKKDFANGFVSTFAMLNLNDAIGLIEPDWTPEKKLRYLLHLPVNYETLNIVEKLPSKERKFFWENVDKYKVLTDETQELIYIVSELRDNSRPFAGLDLINQKLLRSQNYAEIDCKVIASVLINIATKSFKEKPSQNIHYELKQAITFIQNSEQLSEEYILQIEWLYIKLLGCNSFSPRYLIKKVVEDPIFLSKLVTWIYKRSDGNQEPKEELTEPIIKQRAEIAFNLLNVISVLPGQNGEIIDSEFMNHWIDVARDRLRKVGRSEVGDIVMGNILSSCPKGTDGVWPHESVRAVIERLKSRKLESGIITGVFNARGVTTRNPYSGGKQERELAKNFYSDAESLQLIYPRTSEMLRSISRNYEREADREDRDVELID
jgi:hypothetical protein